MRYGKCHYLFIVTSYLDRDTAMSAKTWELSLLASGAVIEACDKIMNGEYSNAFCAVRPPGHHAGIYGKTL